MSSKLIRRLLVLSALLSALPSVSGAGPAAGVQGANLIRLIRAEEKKAVTCRINSSGSVSELTNKHVLELSFRFVVPSFRTGDHDVQPPQLIGDPSGPSGQEKWYVWVANSHGVGIVATDTTRTPLIVDSARIAAGVPAGIGYRIYYNEDIPVQFTGTDPLPGGTITVTIEHWLPPVDPAPAYSVFNKWTYTVTKRTCPDASADTRRTYGQPNKAGELPGDADADLRSINFGDWIFHGGLFVGNVPWTSGDLSGNARIQLYPEVASAHPSPRLVTLSMFAMGAPTGVTGNCELGVFTPTLPDTTSTEGTLTWETIWHTIQPRATLGNPVDFSRDPIYRKSFSGSGPSGTYVNWPLTYVGYSGESTPATVLDFLCVALHGEPDYTNPSARQSAWRYFASKEYELSAEAFPRNDCAPRLWILDSSGSTDWTHQWVNDGPELGR